MSLFAGTGRQGGVWNSNWKVVAATAGFVFFAILLGGAAVLDVARAVWLEPMFGRDAAVAIELAVILPFAWYASSVVAGGMQLSPGWRAAAVMALTTFLLMAGAYLALAATALAEPGSLTNGSLGLDIAVQAALSALPFASRRVLRPLDRTAFRT
jgi:hypothetical protein